MGSLEMSGRLIVYPNTILPVCQEVLQLHASNSSRLGPYADRVKT